MTKKVHSRYLPASLDRGYQPALCNTTFAVGTEIRAKITCGICLRMLAKFDRENAA